MVLDACFWPRREFLIDARASREGGREGGAGKGCVVPQPP